jgi:hypothetical protein
MAEAEWWPKGHSFSPNNMTNIADKSTYIEKYNVFSLPKKIKSTINGLSVAKRKVIYHEIGAAEKASFRKAKARHPNYGNKFYDEEDRLNLMAKSQILKKYKISDETYSIIISEGVNQHW